MARLTRLAALRRPALLGVSGLVLATMAGAAAQEPPHPASLDAAIVRAAARHGIPESLVRRIVMRESKYNPHAHNRAYWGLMQISYPTARSMGFHGSPAELLNPVVNLRYAVPYLANAFIIAGRRQEEAVRLYAAGYYYTARSRGLLGAMRTADSTPLSGVPDEPELVASAAPAPAPDQSSGIFGGLFGPNEMPRDAATQEAIYAPAPSPAQPAEQVAGQPAQQAVALPAGKSSDDVALVADKHGDLQPPKAWRRDGGTTVIARGEQGLEQIAAAKGVDDADRRHRHARKSTQFASVDTPPATAQAYAAVPGQDPRLMQADSQAAISQATAGQPAAPSADPAANQAAAAQPPAVAEEETSSKKSRRKRIARRGHRHETETATAQDQPQGQPPVLSSDQQAAVAPESQPAAASAPVPTADAALQAAPAQDAGAAAQAQFDQSGGPAGDAETSRPHKRHARHGHGHKTAEVAAQASNDSQAQPAPQPPAQ